MDGLGGLRSIWFPCKEDRAGARPPHASRLMSRVSRQRLEMDDMKREM